MKRFFLWLAGILVFILLLLALAPFLFKDTIKQKLDAELAASLNAKVYYDANSLGLSFFSHFPNLTVSLNQFGIVGKGVFETDTLIHVESFSTTLNVASLIGGKPDIVGVRFQHPVIYALRLRDGRANWDILKADTTAPEATTAEPTQFAFNVQGWSVEDADIRFVDATNGTAVAVLGLHHSGSGNFTQDLFDLSTQTEARAVTVVMDSVMYLNNKKIRLNFTAEIDQKAQKYTLKDNAFYINDMGLGAEGTIQLQEKAIALDLTYKSLNGNFKDLLSLVPGFYTKSFDGLKADGLFTLSGLVKGSYQDSLLPRLLLNVTVSQGQFQYPSLPSAVTGIGLDMTIDHAQGTLAHTSIHLKKLEMKLGKNPISAQADIDGLVDMVVNGGIKAKVNLAEISQAFPMDGLELKGLLSVDAQAKGVYSQRRHRIPALNATLTLLDGYVKSKQLPAPIEALTVQAFVNNGTGRMEDTHIRIPSMSLSLDGQPFTASAQIDDLVNYRWDIAAKGTLDLAKMTKIYPVEGTKVSGVLAADIQTRGTMADVTAKRYDRMPTSGTLGFSDFAYKSESLTQGVTASAIALRFSPSQINLEKFDGKAGKSALHLDGALKNYLGYVLSGQTLSGNLNVQSPDFNLNEWMAPTQAPANQTAEPPMEAIIVPRNIDFVVKSTFDKLKYGTMDMSLVVGQVLVHDGIVDLRNLRMLALGGSVKVDGSYDSRDKYSPSYDLTYDMKEVDISALFKTFTPVQALAPVAKSMNGHISTQMRLAGKLDGKMQPVLSSLQGGGDALVSDAQVKDLKAISSLNSVAKLNLPTESALHNLKLSGQILNGRLNFKPFDVNIGSQKLSFAGSNGLDQTLDWKLNTILPASAVGTAASAIPALGAVQGLNQPVPLNFGVTGTHTNPKVSFLGLGKNTVGNMLKDQAKQQTDKLRQEAEQLAKDQAQKLLQGDQDRLKKEAEQKAKDELGKLKGLFK